MRPLRYLAMAFDPRHWDDDRLHSLAVQAAMPIAYRTNRLIVMVTDTGEVNRNPIGDGVTIGKIFRKKGSNPKSPSGMRQNARSSEELRSEEHTSELQSIMRISYAVFCLKKKKK